MLAKNVSSMVYESEDEDGNAFTATVNACPVTSESPENSLASSETNVDMGSPICGRNSPIFEYVFCFC